MTEIKKEKRIVDEELLRELRKGPCQCCGIENSSECHHLQSRKSGGHDEISNILVCCRICHTEIHRRGLCFMTQKYLHLGNILKKKGWELNNHGIWKRYKYKG